MKIEELDVNSLIPYEWNNKIHDEIQVNRIANSIKEFWFTQPLVIDKNNILIVGHWRLEWAKKLWLKKVPCVRAENLTDEQIKKYRILDNKLNESDWDLWNLKLELDWLDDFNFGDILQKNDDMFPEMKTPEFDFWEYDNDDDMFSEDEDKEDNMIKLVVQFDSVDKANIAKEELTNLWYTDLSLKF